MDAEFQAALAADERALKARHVWKMFFFSNKKMDVKTL
jgi:hypothetical protein